MVKAGKCRRKSRKETSMRYSRYDDRDLDWETRFRQACRGREGFAWGAFAIGLIVGAVIF